MSYNDKVNIINTFEIVIGFIKVLNQYEIGTTVQESINENTVYLL